MQESIEKNPIERPKISLQAIVAGVILSITFFLIFVDFQKNYTASLTVLMNAKSSAAALQQEKIIVNLREISQSLSFYERVLRFNKNLKDVSAGKSQDQRKAIWNGMMTIEKVGEGTSIISVSVKAKNEADARRLVLATTRTLLDTAAFYYDVKNDVDFRIVEGPVVDAQVSDWQWMLVLSIFLGMLIAYVLQLVFVFFEKMVLAKRNSLANESFKGLAGFAAADTAGEIKSLNDLYETEEIEAPIDATNKLPENLLDEESVVEKETANKNEKFPEAEIIEKKIYDDIYPNFPEMTGHAQQKSSAPDNLPVAGDEFLVQNEIVDEMPMQETETPVEAEKNELEPHREPTEEELKKRLNQLLKGDL